MNLSRKIIIWNLVASLSGLPLAVAANHQVIGKVVSSSAASLGGIAIPNGGTILIGDTLSTEKGGGALVNLSPTTQASLAEQTSVCFQNVDGHLSARMSLGTIVTETLGKDVLVVETPKYKIEPGTQGKAIYLVSVLPDKSTLVAARYGTVAITENRSGHSYLLLTGQYAAIPASSSGVPGQEKEETKQEPGKQAGQATEEVTEEPWHIGSLSHSASIAVVGAGVGGGVAAAVAAASGGGGGHPASPSRPY